MLDEKEKKQIESLLTERFGIKKIPGTFLMKGKEKVSIYTGSLSENEIKQIEEMAVIENIGFYFGKFNEEKTEFRLSIEATQFLKDQITKNIFEIKNKEQLKNWMHGNELNISTGLNGFIVMKYKNDFLGCGKASEKKISNFIPKNRRLIRKN